MSRAEPDLRTELNCALAHSTIPFRPPLFSTKLIVFLLSGPFQSTHNSSYLPLFLHLRQVRQPCPDREANTGSRSCLPFAKAEPSANIPSDSPPRFPSFSLSPLQNLIPQEHSEPRILLRTQKYAHPRRIMLLHAATKKSPPLISITSLPGLGKPGGQQEHDANLPRPSRQDGGKRKLSLSASHSAVSCPPALKRPSLGIAASQQGKTPKRKTFCPISDAYNVPPSTGHLGEGPRNGLLQSDACPARPA